MIQLKIKLYIGDVNDIMAIGGNMEPGVKTVLRTKMYWLTDETTYLRLEVYVPSLASRVNKELRTFLTEDGTPYKFKTGEEGVFRVPCNQKDYFVSKYLKTRGGRLCIGPRKKNSTLMPGNV